MHNPNGLCSLECSKMSFERPRISLRYPRNFACWCLPLESLLKSRKNVTFLAASLLFPQNYNFFRYLYFAMISAAFQSFQYIWLRSRFRRKVAIFNQSQSSRHLGGNFRPIRELSSVRWRFSTNHNKLDTFPQKNTCDTCTSYWSLVVLHIEKKIVNFAKVYRHLDYFLCRTYSVNLIKGLEKF